MLTKVEIDNMFYYENGELYNKHTRGRAVANKLAGAINSRGYRHIRIQNKFYLVHRLIWIIFNNILDDSVLIDHKDGNKANNLISNLRIATYSENSMNKIIATNNTSGVKGVYFSRNNWYAQIGFNNKRVRIKCDTFEEACKQIKVLKEKHHKDFSK